MLNPIRWLLNSIILFQIIFGLSGCFSESKPPETATVRIVIAPKARVNSSVVPFAAGKQPRSMAVPATIEDFTCFGVNIAGPGIPKTRPAEGCSVSVALDLGLHSGLVPVTGGTLELSVPVGSQRVVQIFGVTTTSGTCPTKEELVSNGPNIGATHPPFEVGRTITDILNSVEVVVDSNYDAAAVKRAFCSDITLANADTWGEAVWDSADWQ